MHSVFYPSLSFIPNFRTEPLHSVQFKDRFSVILCVSYYLVHHFKYRSSNIGLNFPYFLVLICFHLLLHFFFVPSVLIYPSVNSLFPGQYMTRNAPIYSTSSKSSEPQGLFCMLVIKFCLNSHIILQAYIRWTVRYDNEFCYLEMGKFLFFLFYYQEKMLNKVKKLSLENYIRRAVMLPVFLIGYLENCFRFGTLPD
jgi:hypothetical protein